MNRWILGAAVIAATALPASLAMPTPAEAGGTFAELSGMLGKPCDRRLLRDARDWGFTFTEPRGSMVEWPGPGMAKIVCKGREPVVIRIELDRDWPLPAAMLWKTGWGKAKKLVGKRGGTVTRAWKDEEGKHMIAVVDGVKVGMHWPKKLGQVAIEKP